MPWLLEMTLIVSAIMAAAHLYTGWRMMSAIRKLSDSQFFKYLPLLLLLSFYLLPVIAYGHYVFRGDPNLLEYPKAMVYWFWFGLIFSFQLATWFLILDAIRLVLYITKIGDRRRMNRWYGWAAVGMVLVLFIFTATKMIRDTGTIQTDEIIFELDEPNQNLSGLRIVHITDLQGDQYTGREEIAEYVEQINALNPDLVIFTGDLISYGTEFIDMAAQELSKTEADRGVYAVIGDHDYWAGVDNIKSALDQYGISLLQDENRAVPVNNDSLLLTGITEVYSRQIPREKLDSLITDTTQTSLKIMATHQATGKVIDAAKQGDYDMVLGGHTHGGQLRVPFLGMTFSAAEEETPYVSGVFWSDDLFININNGLGFTLAPVRYNAPPNISVIDFQ